MGVRELVLPFSCIAPLMVLRRANTSHLISNLLVHAFVWYGQSVANSVNNMRLGSHRIRRMLRVVSCPRVDDCDLLNCLSDAALHGLTREV